MREAYFFRTLFVSGRNRLRALEGQIFGDTLAPVNSAFNVSSDKTIRARYPVGTIFGSWSLIDRDSFYEAGQLFVLDTEPLEDTHRPPTELVEAYKMFKEGVTAPTDSPKKDEPLESARVSSPKKTLLEKIMSNPALKAPNIMKEGFYVSDDSWNLLVRNITNNVNTMLIGPTGTGKTELILKACKKLGKKCHVYDMGSMYDPVAGLLGVHRLQKGGVSTFDYAKFTQDIQEPGVVLLDELSRAPVTTNNILFPCLDSRRSLPVEIAGGDDLRTIKVHEDCCFIATANVGAEYTGTMSMDRALTCRFFPIELSYLPIDIETGLLRKRCLIQESVAKNISYIANKVREMYMKQEVSSAVSTRETLMVGDLIADGWTPTRAMELVFLPLFEGSMMEGERSIIAKIIMSK